MAVTDVLKKVVIAALTPIYSPGSIRRVPSVDDGKGGYTSGSPQTFPCLVQVDTVTESMKSEDGYTDKDVALFVLQTPGLTLNADDQVIAEETTWDLGILKQDPVKAAWEVRGTPSHG